MLVKFCSDRHSTRDTYLDACTFAYNTSRQESTKYSPFELMFGRKPVLPVELDVADESPETLLSDFNTIPECSQPLMDKMIEARYETFLIKFATALANGVQPAWSLCRVK